MRMRIRRNSYSLKRDSIFIICPIRTCQNIGSQHGFCLFYARDEGMLYRRMHMSRIDSIVFVVTAHCYRYLTVLK